MTAAGLLRDCQERGIRLALARDGGLVIDAPKDALTPELLARLREHKPELLRLLTAPPRCAMHLRFADWIETPAVDRPGWLRTTCRVCGTFIGYRPTLN